MHLAGQATSSPPVISLDKRGLQINIFSLKGSLKTTSAVVRYRPGAIIKSIIIDRWRITADSGPLDNQLRKLILDGSSASRNPPIWEADPHGLAARICIACARHQSRRIRNA